MSERGGGEKEKKVEEEKVEKEEREESVYICDATWSGGGWGRNLIRPYWTMSSPVSSLLIPFVFVLFVYSFACVCLFGEVILDNVKAVRVSSPSIPRVCVIA